MFDPIKLAASLIATDSRSFVSNVAVADKIEAVLSQFEIERLDYTDPAGVLKRVLVAHKGPMGGGLAMSDHMDTVPATGWQDDPCRPRPSASSFATAPTSIRSKWSRPYKPWRCVQDRPSRNHARGCHRTHRATTH